ncbi:hypothetical protein PAUR_a0637 [Pseudoalteromonas aurantia 208]|uniref:Uncharacterized protein n=1 Tax=Pseudoalteromonas aurantia 208 TaxID=1314867 RepID=A0ABR9E8H8_9GAMM|nr:hypothetical protein [Pseudoalteromonas aurantia 208]
MNSNMMNAMLCGSMAFILYSIGLIYQGILPILMPLKS